MGCLGAFRPKDMRIVRVMGTNERRRWVLTGRHGVASLFVAALVVAAGCGVFWLYDSYPCVLAWLRGEYLVVIIESPGSEGVDSGMIVRLKGRITNVSSTAIRLVDRSSSSVHCDGLPHLLAPYESASFEFVADTTRRWGLFPFIGGIATDRVEQHHVPIEVPIKVKSPEVSQQVVLGCCRFGESELDRVITIPKLPGSKLKAIKSCTIPGWNIEKVDSEPDNLKLRVRGSTKDIKIGKDSLPNPPIEFKLVFADDCVESARVVLYGSNIQEWDYPELLSVTPLNSQDGQLDFFIRHCPIREGREDASAIEILQDDKSGITTSASEPEFDSKRGPQEKIFRVRVAIEGSRHDRMAHLKIKMIGDNGVPRVVVIPLIVSGFRF